MDRRSLLKSLAAAGAVALLPDDAAFAAWIRVGSRTGRGLTDAQLARIGAIADVILPRTDTPSATDVGVPAFVDIIVSENYSADDRAAFVANLDALHPNSLGAIEAADRRAEPQRTYWRAPRSTRSSRTSGTSRTSIPAASRAARRSTRPRS